MAPKKTSSGQSRQGPGGRGTTAKNRENQVVSDKRRRRGGARPAALMRDWVLVLQFKRRHLPNTASRPPLPPTHPHLPTPNPYGAGTLH